MTEIDEKGSQEPKSSLSAEANVFIPRKVSQSPGSNGRPPQRLAGYGVPYAGAISNPVQEIPEYMINCYPFVQEDPSRRNPRWPPSGPGPGPRYRPQSPADSTGAPFKSQGHGGGRTMHTAAPPHSFNYPPPTQGPGLPRNAAPLSFPYGAPPSGSGINPVMPCPVPQVQAVIPSNAPLYGSDTRNQPVIPDTVWPPHNTHGQGQRSWQKSGQRSTGMGQQLSKVARAANVEEDKAANLEKSKRERRNSGKKADRKRDNRQPTGKTPNNLVGQVGLVKGGNSTPGPKTIMLIDNAVQTDFPLSIANITLREKPNLLFKNTAQRNRRLSSKGGYSSAEEVDSDSGYNSPLHRRNMVSNGTHPPEIQSLFLYRDILDSPKSRSDLTYITARVPPIAGPASDVPSKLSYAVIAQKPPPPKVPSHEPASSANEVQDGNFVRGSRGRTSSSNQKGGKGRQRSISQNNAVETAVLKNDSKLDGNLIVNGEETKKKRKRTRKRRKKPGEATGEGDHKENSSSLNTSGQDLGVAVDNEPVLHFEDVDEFPDLLSSNLSQSGTGFTAAKNVSYSQILTARTNVHTSASKAGRCVSFLTTPSHLPDSDDGEGEEGGRSETKTARKRRKRREKANRAAEDELAEISVEQQMLRELNLKKHPPFQPQHLPQTIVRQPQTLAQRLMANQPMGTTKTTAQQEVVKETIKEPKPKASGKKSQQPIAFDIGAMIDALEQKKVGRPKKKDDKGSGNKITGPNVLDSSAPVVKRGKERENPKPKKPSSLKKVILKEREERKRSRIIGEDPIMTDDMTDVPRAAVGVGVVTAESDLSQDGVDNSESDGSRLHGVAIPKVSSTDIGGGTSANSDLSPISQTSPISMTPLSSGVNSPVVGHVSKEVTQAAMKIHSRRFREYCHQVLDKEIDACCTTLLQDLVRFQDRAYHKDPTKAKAKRRIVLGLREVTKHLKLRKIKCVIISPNLEKIQAKGGLDEALNKIIELCDEQNVPFVFALGRRALGRACAKLVPVSVAGIFNYEGSEANFQQLMDQTAVGRQAYRDMVTVLEREIMENPVKATSHIYAHMGHSRTPSACSAISFTSSVLSEPISENYPQSEPEVDSKGNEIIRFEDIENLDEENLVNQSKSKASSGDQTGSSERSGGANPSSVSVPGEKDTLPRSPRGQGAMCIDDIDDGNEADTEDVDGLESSVNPQQGPPVRKEDEREDGEEEEDYDEDEADYEDDYEDDDEDDGNDGDIADGDNFEEHDTDNDDDINKDVVEDLPHIDSFHASTHDLSAEILSQHSARTGDTVEGASTHSSRTVGDGSSTLTTECLRQDPHHGIAVDAAANSTKLSLVTGAGDVACHTSGSQHTKIVDRERIKSWVEQSQTCIQFHLDESTSESQQESEEVENSSTDDMIDVGARQPVNTNNSVDSTDL